MSSNQLAFARVSALSPSSRVFTNPFIGAAVLWVKGYGARNSRELSAQLGQQAVECEPRKFLQPSYGGEMQNDCAQSRGRPVSYEGLRIVWLSV